MDFNRRHTGGIAWSQEFARQVGRAINDLEEDTAADATTDYVVTYDASTNKPKKVLVPSGASGLKHSFFFSGA